MNGAAFFDSGGGVELHTKLLLADRHRAFERVAHEDHRFYFSGKHVFLRSRGTVHQAQVLGSNDDNDFLSYGESLGDAAGQNSARRLHLTRLLPVRTESL